ncbi:MAG: hypothetical protein JWR44_668 [Hymenobacter sp.]|nr:hypothetical protein [Hymenobacter sp.]
MLLKQAPLSSHLFRLATFAAGLLLGTGCARQHYFQTDARPDTSRVLPATADSVRGVTAGRQYARHGRLYGALVGQHHRRTWAAPVDVPVLRLAEAQPGGLRPGKVGGGFNSTSLSLEAADGHNYVLRTVDKDPIRATPQLLRGTFLVNVLRDNISSTNPYAALAVPPLAAAVSVPHTSPRLFYVRAEDPSLQGDSLRLFRGQLAYLEEKTAVQAGMSGQSTVNSTETFKAVFASPIARIDQMALLRARLLDAWLGDWDRHPGQWNWAVKHIEAPHGTTYSPLPKDRDMVFYRLDDGLLGWLIGHVAIRHWVSFGARYKNPVALLSNGEYLDRRALNGLSRAQFQAAAAAMQKQLPDSLLNRAVHRLPPAAFALEGPGTIAALQARREALPAVADALYYELARLPMVGGTAQAETFVIKRYADSTQVAVYPGVSGTGPPLFRRTYLSSETKEISLQGLGGDDTFIISSPAGQAAKGGIRLRMYGGPGNDTLVNDIPSSKPGKRNRFIQGSAPEKQAYDKLPEE